MTAWPVARAVAVVKLNVMGLPVAPGTRSPGWIVRETPVTRPPSAPEAAPAETRSELVETDIPVGKPGLGGPIVMPARVMVTIWGGMKICPNNVITTKSVWVGPLCALKPDTMGKTFDAKKPLG